MADRIEKKVYSYDEWKTLGPLFHNDRDDDYDGFRGEAPTTPNWASLYVGGPNKVLGNPDHSSRRDDFTNAHSQWMHVMKTLSRGDQETVKFVREAAKAGDKMADISERKHGDPNAWVAIASDAGTAQVLRDTIQMTLEHFPRAQGVKRQELPTSVDHIPLDAMKKQMEGLRPKRFRRRVLENGMVRHAAPSDKEQASDAAFASANRSKLQTKMKMPAKQFSGTLAIFADEGMEDEAAKFMAGLDSRILPCPEKNKALTDAVAPIRPKGAFYPRDYDPNAKQGKAGDELLQRCDAAVFFTNGDPTSRVTKLLAEGSRLGKASRVIEPTGEVDLFEAAREAEAAHASKKEIAQSFSAPAFDISAKDPMAYIGLTQVRDQKLGYIGDKDLSRIAGMDETVNEIAEMDGDWLRREGKLSSGAIRLLKSADAMSAGREGLLKIRGEISQHDLKVVGVDGYSDQMMASGQPSPYLLAEGNLDLLRNPGTTIGVSGTTARNDSDGRLVSSQNAGAVAALASQPATLAYVQGQTDVEIPSGSPQIMISTVGKAHLSDEARAQQEAVIENGGAVIHMQPPESRSWHYDAKAINKETGKKGALVPTPSTADPAIDRKGAALLGAMSDTVVVTSMNSHEAESAPHVAAMTGLRIGRTPTFVNFEEYRHVQHVSGNRAMTGKRGSSALIGAGFGERDVEQLRKRHDEGRDVAAGHASTFDEKKHGIDTGKNMDVAMQNLVRHLDGQEIQVAQKSRARQVGEAEM